MAQQLGAVMQNALTMDSSGLSIREKVRIAQGLIRQTRESGKFENPIVSLPQLFVAVNLISDALEEWGHGGKALTNPQEREEFFVTAFPEWVTASTGAFLMFNEQDHLARVSTMGRARNSFRTIEVGVPCFFGEQIGAQFELEFLFHNPKPGVSLNHQKPAIVLRWKSGKIDEWNIAMTLERSGLEVECSLRGSRLLGSSNGGFDNLVLPELYYDYYSYSSSFPNDTSLDEACQQGRDAFYSLARIVYVEPIRALIGQSFDKMSAVRESGVFNT